MKIGRNVCSAPKLGNLDIPQPTRATAVKTRVEGAPIDLIMRMTIIKICMEAFRQLRNIYRQEPGISQQLDEIDRDSKLLFYTTFCLKDS